MCTFEIKIVDINALPEDVVKEIYERLCWREYEPGCGSMREELTRRYIDKEPGPHKSMALALIRHNSFLAAWVGTRIWTEVYNGVPTDMQTIECFTDIELRRRGLAQLGAQALVAAGVLNRAKAVAVYHPNAAEIADNIGCVEIVLVSTGRW
jgi:hypothetical protein